jgi:hypothetical protein
MPVQRTTKKASIDSTHWRMYELLIAELQHLHTVWTDNYRVILTFNSFWLPGSLGAWALVMRDGSTAGEATLEVPAWSILIIMILCAIGIMTTLVMMMLIRRTKEFTVLRQREVRKIEQFMIHDLPVHPFLEGYVLGGGPPKGFEKIISDVSKMRFYWFNSYVGYTLISFGFIVAYLILGVISVLLWMR